MIKGKIKDNELYGPFILNGGLLLPIIIWSIYLFTFTKKSNLYIQMENNGIGCGIGFIFILLSWSLIVNNFNIPKDILNTNNK